jgi:serine/threonine protein kinase
MFIISGGYGTVYRAQRTKDGKTFAIKCMNSKPPVFM